MKNLTTLLAVFASVFAAGQARAATTVYMPYSYDSDNPRTAVISEATTLTYQGYWAEEDMSEPVSIYLVPANEGDAIRVTFTYIYNFGTDQELKVYNGQTDVSENWAYTLPSGELGSGEEGKIYESTAADGSLTVAYYNGAYDYVRWTATVECFSNADMAYSETVAAAPGTAIVGAASQPLMAVDVKTTGAANALSLTGLTFDMAGTANASNFSNLRVYSTGREAAFSLAGATAVGTLAESGSTVTATGSVELSGGDNYFWLVGDISAAAAVGDAIDVTCTSVQIGGAEALTAPVASTGHSVGNTLLMPASGVYSIGASGLNFYDDGGKDGKISSKFEGAVTFKPTTEGKVVQVDFTKVELYESTYGSTTYDDIIKVYNGQGTTDLIEQVYNGEPKIVRSTAADGSLTVYLKSVTGDYYRGNGFEAFVSEYSPAPMTVTGVETQAGESTVAAGDTDLAILAVNVKTQNTIAISASSFTFSTEGTTDLSHLSKATLYYTGKSSDFSTAVKVGEAVPTGLSEFSISCGQELAEGSNYFWLAYDIDPRAANGETVAAGCVSVTAGGESHAPASASPAGSATVDNVIKSTVGTTEKTIYGTWTFIDTPNPLSYYNGYEPVEGDQTTIFVPGNAGKIIEIDFEAFSLYYSSSSYSYYPKAKFEIYSGKGTSGELLWSLTSADDKDKGPGRVLRSKSADGALTVVFNANTTSSSYTSTGWTASVSEYEQRPMSLSSVAATQSSVDIVNPGVEGADLLDIAVTTDGDLSALIANGFTFDLKGSPVDAINVYYYGSDNTATDTPLATVAVGDATEPVVAAFNRSIELSEGTNYFHVTCDVSAGAAVDSTVDAALTAVKIGEETVSVDAADGDPEGARTVKNIYLLQSGDNGEVAVGDVPLVFYDEGGAEGKTSKPFTGYVTFAPKDAGKVVKMTFNSFSINYNDKFTVDNGGEVKTTADHRISSKPDAPILSTSDDGKLTVYFNVPSYSYASDGWEIELVQYEPQPLVAETLTVEAVASATTVRGASDVAMLHASVVVGGDKGELSFSGFSVATDGTSSGALAAVSVAATGTASAYSTNNQLAKADASPYELTTDYTVTAPGTYHFWIACDASAAANPGDAISLSLTKVVAGGEELAPAAAVASSTTLKKGASGTLTVGPDGDFATIQAAIDDIADGVEGPVVINVQPGEYEELVTVPEIPGTSAANTITLQSESGEPGDVVISYDTYTEPTYTDDKMAYEYGVFTFSGADYFTLRNVTVTTTDQTFPSIVHFRDRSQHCTVDNCHVYTDRSESYSYDITLIGQYAKSVENYNSDYATISNNLLEGGYYGIRVAGASTVSLPRQEGVTVEGNTLRNQGNAAILAITTDKDLTIRGNIIENSASTKSGFMGMDLQTGEGLLIEGNSLALDLSVYATGIYLRKATGTAEKPVRIVNNEVMVKSSSATTSGIKINNPSTFVDVAHNTVLVDGDASSEAGVAFYLNDQMTDFTVTNNIFQVKNGGYAYRFYKETCLQGTTFANNAVYTNGSTFAKTSSSTTLATFGDWVTKTGDSSSYNDEVVFLSSSILFPAAEGNLRNAVPLSYVATDIQGDARDAERPTIGAYEYGSASAVPAFAEGYPAVSGITHVSATATLAADANGKAYMAVKTAEDAAPTADEVKASGLAVELRKGKAVSAALTGLEQQTDYALYALLESLDGTANGGVVKAAEFSTAYTPTEVSTFENVTATDTGFDDGTASFFGFTVEETDDAVVEGTKVAKVGEGATIALTNTVKGFVLTGFFLKSDAEVTMNTYDAAGDMQTYTLASTGGEWKFSNLKDKGVVLALDMATTGSAYIDNFSGTPLDFAIAAESAELTVAAGEAASLSAIGAGGVEPYSFVWTDAMNSEVSAEAAFATEALAKPGVYIVTATDAWGSTSADRVLVYVSGAESEAATFDDLYLADESYYNGYGEDDSSWTSPGTSSKFFSGTYEFSTEHHTATWWGGFGYSNQTSTDFASLTDQYKSAVGSGHNSANYGVAYSYTGASYAIRPSASLADGEEVEGFYVSNSAYTADAIVNGDGMSTVAGGFAEGDYLKLTVTGEKADGSTATVDYYLADYRSDNAADRYYLDTWQWVDLRPLGAVKSLTFGFEGTKRNSYGLTTPTYFCLDDFGGEREIAEEVELLTGTVTVGALSLEQIFPLPDDGSTMAYAITDAPDGAIAEAAIADGILTVTGKTDKSQTELIVSATNRGRIEFARVNVVVDEYEASTASLEVTEGVSVYPVPATDRLNIATALSGYTVSVYTVGGRCVLTEDGLSGNAVIPVSGLAKGVYILTVTTDSQSIAKRFIVK